MFDPMRRHVRVAAFVRSAILSCAAIAAALVGTSAQAQDAPPSAAAFARIPLVDKPRLSPDGKHLLVSQRLSVNGRDAVVLFVYRLADMAVLAQVRVGGADNYWWVSDTRVVVASGGELFAMNLDGTGQEYLFGRNMRSKGRSVQTGDRSWGEVAGIAEERDGTVYVNDHTWYPNSVRTMLYAINSKNGVRKLLAEAPLRGVKYVMQRDGTPRYAVAGDENALRTVLQYVDDKKEWVRLNTDDQQYLEPVGFGADDTAFFAIRSDRGGPGALVRQAVKGGPHELLASDPVGTIDRIEWGPRRLVPVAATTLVGIPSPRYVDPASSEAQLHKSLSAQFPGSYVSFESFSDDGQKLMFGVWSDRDPGSYYVLDRATNQAAMLFSRMPQIDPARMGTRRPISFKARDGLELHGYVTLPPGGGDKGLPLVLNPHGGPITADTWFFDTDAQFLATRGYAVLEVNFRGSGGRGTAFESRGYRHLGDLVPDDMIDGVRWAIAEGVADPSRICAYGSGFGANEAMMAAIRAPELFRCIAGQAGFYDLPAVYETDEIRLSPQQRAYAVRSIGEDTAELVRFSPARQADKIKAPVLLVHGEEDRRAPVAHLKAMQEGLQKAGKPFETMLVQDEGHGFYAEKNRLAFYERLEAFLAKYLRAAKP